MIFDFLPLISTLSEYQHFRSFNIHHKDRVTFFSTDNLAKIVRYPPLGAS